MAKKRAQTKPKPDKSPKAEYQRFLEVAREVGASDDPKDLDKALNKVTASPKSRNG